MVLLYMRTYLKRFERKRPSDVEYMVVIVTNHTSLASTNITAV